MKTATRDLRYNLLLHQFEFHYDEQLNIFEKEFKEFEASLERMRNFIYHYTDIMYLEFVNEKMLYNYIKHHSLSDFKEVSFTEAIKDVKNFLYFLRHIKDMSNIPDINISTNNFYLWSEIESEARIEE